MNVAQLFHKLRVISNIEIVIPLLPEMLRVANQPSRYSLLQRLQRIAEQGNPIQDRWPIENRWPIQAALWLEWGISIAERIPLRFTEQQMNMLRHNHIPVNLKPETTPHPLQAQLEDSPAFVAAKQRTPVITAESNEMTLPATLKPRQSPRHEDNLACSLPASL